MGMSPSKKKHTEFLNAHRHLYKKMLKAQKGHCALCPSTPSEKRRLDLDHDHTLMEIRGLLCVRCNRALHDWMDKEWLEKAAQYVLR